MELHRIIKSDAKHALRKCWSKSVAAALVLFATYFSISAAESVFLFVFSEDTLTFDFLSVANASLTAVIITCVAVFAFIVFMPALTLGFIKLNFAFADGKKENVSSVFDMFSSFKSFIRSIVFTVAISVRYIFCAFVAFVPGSILFYLAETFIISEDRTIQLLKISACCVSVALIILCLSLAFIFSQRWFASSYYFISGRKIHESFSLSVKASKGMRTHIAGFKISFFGWWLLCIFILPVFWTLPYYAVSCAIYAKYLISKLEHVPIETPIVADKIDEEENN